MKAFQNSVDNKIMGTNTATRLFSFLLIIKNDSDEKYWILVHNFPNIIQNA